MAQPHPARCSTWFWGHAECTFFWKTAPRASRFTRFANLASRMAGTPAAFMHVDRAFVCMNLPYTMEVVQAADVVLAFKPKVVYPYPYRGQDTAKFKQLVHAKDPHIDVRLRNWYAHQLGTDTPWAGAHWRDVVSADAGKASRARALPRGSCNVVAARVSNRVSVGISTCSDRCVGGLLIQLSSASLRRREIGAPVVLISSRGLSAVTLQGLS